MNNYPSQPGAKTATPETSVASAAKMAGKSSTLRERVLLQLGSAPKGLTADECAARMGETVLAVRPRFAELHHMGKIEDANIRRPNASGHGAVVWKLIDKNQPQKELTL
jgi:predicted ArsR family transcriptional regulator